LAAKELRSALRHFTQDSHERLDALVGMFDDKESYRRFLTGSYWFRKSLQAACARIDFWPIELWLEELVLDLHDLGDTDIVPVTMRPISAPTRADQLGLLYVLEGSGLGARLLLRRTEKLGYGPEYGARHLYQQTADRQRWPACLALLEASDGIDQDLALGTAQACFMAAIDIFTEVLHDPIQPA